MSIVKWLLQKIQIWLKSKDGPIEVFLCPEKASEQAASTATIPEVDTSYTSSEDSRDSFTSKKNF